MEMRQGRHYIVNDRIRGRILKISIEEVTETSYLCKEEDTLGGLRFRLAKDELFRKYEVLEEVSEESRTVTSSDVVLNGDIANQMFRQRFEQANDVNKDAEEFELVPAWNAYELYLETADKCELKCIDKKIKTASKQGLTSIELSRLPSQTVVDYLQHSGYVVTEMVRESGGVHRLAWVVRREDYKEEDFYTTISWKDTKKHFE